jgi:hypothetical protein
MSQGTVLVEPALAVMLAVLMPVAAALTLELVARGLVRHNP